MNTHLLLLLSMGASQGPTLARCAGAQELVSLGAQDRGWKDPALDIWVEKGVFGLGGLG